MFVDDVVLVAKGRKELEENRWNNTLKEYEMIINKNNGKKRRRKNRYKNLKGTHRASRKYLGVEIAVNGK